ncbi:Peptide deformylase 1 [Streptococcus sp. BCA20]|jgi:peptide deformylase|uniref:Peptide deformylase n=1 Tax=Streptococcus intermedius TaxID=1338 RepID=A0AAD1C997_STRIT|nr:peptide deformylase [Streptococcus intermedius]RSJ29739.1 Peptide deformylase 1 [Streptococcus sp. BCA20]MCI3918489.1 peptide deformylase [Streptococcus intermedius]MDK8091687.1 peptide deformylase [Streptococcus intermedius]RSJ25949.1 Peptide deformylase 1 [Streptococcus intermedius]BAW17568.1 peptide deformylase [Streptococcus intermedius]
MIKPIVKDLLFLQQKAQLATEEDIKIGQDLLDTLKANQDRCVGMAANMIGVQKRAIIFMYGMVPVIMFNPILKKKVSPYQVEESCLSLVGSCLATRYKEITVEYLDRNWQKQTLILKDFPAQICQHELDHLEGILI